MNKHFFTLLLFTVLVILGCGGQTEKTQTLDDRKAADEIVTVAETSELERTESEPASEKTEETEKTEAKETDIIRVTYNQKINGYQVNVIWQPNMIRHGEVLGPAILNFKNEESEFTLTNNFFSLPVEIARVKSEDNYMVEGVQHNNISIDYKEPNLENENFESIDVPIAFMDVNFDGKKELLLEKALQGQRSIDSYDVYSFSYGDLEMDLYQITKEEPYNQIDDMARIDRDRKELIIAGSGGACYTLYHTYSFVNNHFILTKVERMESEAEKCYLFTYSVKDRVETFVSKKEIK